MIPADTTTENKRISKNTDELFMSFNFWLTTKEIKQLELLTIQYETQPAIIVQRILRHALKQLKIKQIYQEGEQEEEVKV